MQWKSYQFQIFAFLEHDDMENFPVFFGSEGSLLWRHNERASQITRLHTQLFIQAQIKENTKASRHWSLFGEYSGDLWIPRPNGQ